MYENILLGLPRIRQVRVKKKSCRIFPDFKDRIKECYGHYDLSREETQPLSQRWRNHKKVWNYSDSLKTGSFSHWGYFTTYGGGGYCQDLSRKWNESLLIIKQLKKDLWIDKATRAVFLDFTVFNVNLNIFAVIRLDFWNYF